MSSEHTGYKIGTLSPAIYFERADGYVIMAPEEIGNTALARMVYETQYRAKGWEWREADTLAKVDALQKRLTEQQMRKVAQMVAIDERMREVVRKAVAQNLQRRMTDPKTTAYEAEFIEHYLKLRESKRSRYRDALEHRNYYLWAREQDSGTKVEDRL